MSEKPYSAAGEAAARDELLSLEALLIGRLCLYTLFHKAFGGEPNADLLRLMTSPAAIDAVDEYAIADGTMAGLKSFFAGLSGRTEDEYYLDNVMSEYTRFFVGPADLPAYPWEAPYISHEATVFQKSTLVIRDVYRTYGFQVKMYKRVPDDHISLMCAFLARLAGRSLDMFRAGQTETLRVLMAGQYSFIQDHMKNWLTDYAVLACKANTAYLYPQLVKGIEAFARLDGNFAAEVLAWIDDLSGEVKTMLADSLRERPVAFVKAEKAIRELEAIKLVGLDENELVTIV